MIRPYWTSEAKCFSRMRAELECHWRSQWQIKRYMAGAGGFEPPYRGIKIFCLTTWLRPNDPGRLSGMRRTGNMSAGPPSPYWRQDRSL